VYAYVGERRVVWLWRMTTRCLNFLQKENTGERRVAWLWRMTTRCLNFCQKRAGERLLGQPLGWGLVVVVLLASADWQADAVLGGRDWAAVGIGVGAVGIVGEVEIDDEFAVA
jgi:hypothetical protein